MDEQLRQCAFDRCELIETGIAGVEFLDQFLDQVLKAGGRGGSCGCELHSIDPLDQTLDQHFQLVGHIWVVSIARLELLGKHGDPGFERGQSPAVSTAPRVIELGTESTYLFRQLCQCLVRCRMGDDAAHRGQGTFKLLEDRCVPSASDDVDLVGELLHHARHAEKAFSRPQGA